MAKMLTSRNAVKIDGALLRKEIIEKYKTFVQCACDLRCSASMITDSCKRNQMTGVYYKQLCQLLGKPEEYFYFKEEEEVVKKSADEVKVDSADDIDTFNVQLFVELKKIEALLMSINRHLTDKPLAEVKMRK